MSRTRLVRLSIEDLMERLEDIERRAASGVSMTIGRTTTARDYTDKDDNQHRKHNRTLALWLKAYIQKRIDDEQH